MTRAATPGSPRITFIGAGSVVFIHDLLGDLMSLPELREATIALHDIDEDRLATATAIARRTASQLGAHPTIEASLDRRSALAGADFVVNVVAVGGHDATRTDFEVPRAFGLKQTIADTLGVGGIFRALRTFPILDAIAVDMAEVCPDAWLLNYTNPMAMNVWYLSQAHPAIKSVGLCHSVYWTVMGLNEIVGANYDDVSYAAAGVNHQAWLLRWERDGKSLYPLLDEQIAADEQLRRRVRVDMYRRLGYYPTETSEHSSEYVPWYLRSPAEVDRLRIPIDEYLRISEENLQEYADTKALLERDEPLQIAGTMEYAPQVIHSMTTNTRRVIHGNVANRGYITNLPDGAAVEVPCVVDELGLRPMHVGDLPVQCVALNRAFVSVDELVVAAAMEQNPRRVRQAAMVDPNTAAQLDVDQIWALCDAMVEAHGDRLPKWLAAPVTL